MGEDWSDPAPTHAPQGRARAVAGHLALGWSASLLVIGVLLLLVFPVLVQQSEDSYCENDDHPGPCASALELFGPALVVLPVATWCLTASVSFRRGRRWARPALVATFSLLAVGPVVALAAEVSGSDSPRPDAVLTSLGFLAWFVTTAVLAAAGGARSAQDTRVAA